MLTAVTLDTDRYAGGRPAPERKWQEYFVQLVGTIMSLWDASELDQVGGDQRINGCKEQVSAPLRFLPRSDAMDGSHPARHV